MILLYKIVIAIIIAVIVWKWIFFVLLSPVIIFLNKNYNTSKADSTCKPVNYDKTRNRLRICISRYIHGGIRYMDYEISHIPSHRIRNFVYKYIFRIHIGDHAIIYHGAEIRAHSKLYIGNGSIIGDNAILDARNGILIGENVNLSSRVSIWTEQHDHRDPWFRCNSNDSFKVDIGDRVWIGPNVTILHSITIGEGAVIAAGSVVTKNIEPYSIYAGVPAKKIGDRTKELYYKFEGKPIPFL